MSFDADHSVIQAQQLVNAVIDADESTFGIYRLSPQPRINVLSDIRAIAGRTLAYATPADLKPIIPADLFNAYRAAVADEPSRPGPDSAVARSGLTVPARAVVAAVGTVAALKILESMDIATAADELRWLVTMCRERGLRVNPSNMGWGQNKSVVFAGVQLAAVGPLLNPSDQVRYGIDSPLRRRQRRGMIYATQLARRLPSYLWPAWSLPLSICGCHQQQLRPALSTVLLLADSRLTLDEAARLIDSPIDGRAVSRVLQLLEQQEYWPNIRVALSRMAEYLGYEVPIDYDRRRHLDWTTLLPDKVWARICRDTATPGTGPARAKVVRCYLFERLSGLPASAAPWGPTNTAFRTKVADFPHHLNPELAAALNEHACAYLGHRDIHGEPAIWDPPTDILRGLVLPGPDIGIVEIADLHRIHTAYVGSMGATAAQLGITLDSVRYLLDRNPSPRLTPEPGSPLPIPYNRAYSSTKSVLSRQRFVELYECQQKSLRDIASMLGVSRQVITKLAIDYDVQLRERGRGAAVRVDREWLYTQYVTERRVLSDLAREVGTSTSNMARLAKRLGVPLRERGHASHRATLAAQRGR